MVDQGRPAPEQIHHQPAQARRPPHTALKAQQPLAPGTPVDVCIRPTQIMIIRPDRPPSGPRQNTLHGCIVEERIQAETYRLFLRLAGGEREAGSSQPEPAEAGPMPDDAPSNHDLEIELPGYVYFRLGLDQRKEITVSIRRDAVWVIGAEER